MKPHPVSTDRHPVSTDGHPVAPVLRPDEAAHSRNRPSGRTIQVAANCLSILVSVGVCWIGGSHTVVADERWRQSPTPNGVDAVLPQTCDRFMAYQADSSPADTHVARLAPATSASIPDPV